jgi:hypothetical protein
MGSTTNSFIHSLSNRVIFKHEYLKIGILMSLALVTSCMCLSDEWNC